MHAGSRERTLPVPIFHVALGLGRGLLAQPGSAGSSAIPSLPGDNRTFSNPGSTCNSATLGNSPNSLCSAAVSRHRLRTADDDPAGRPFGRLHPAPGALIVDADLGMRLFAAIIFAQLLLSIDPKL